MKKSYLLDLCASVLSYLLVVDPLKPAVSSSAAWFRINLTLRAYCSHNPACSSTYGKLAIHPSIHPHTYYRTLHSQNNPIYYSKYHKTSSSNAQLPQPAWLPIRPAYECMAYAHIYARASLTHTHFLYVSISRHPLAWSTRACYLGMPACLPLSC